MDSQHGPLKIAIPLAQAVSALGLAEYQDGAVVSRTLFANEGGTITFFAFAEGQGLSEHTAPFDAIVHVLDGEARITIAGKPVMAKAGDLVLMPANQPHALAAQSRFKMLLIMIRSRHEAEP